MTVQWIEDFNTGVEEIDLHHEGMAEKINELLNAIDSGEKIATIRTLIIFFESFLASHFVLEEMLQQKFAYPDYRSHYDQHIKLAETFSGLNKLIETEGTSPHFVPTARGFIMDWWNSYIYHINSADKQLTEFLKTQWYKKGMGNSTF